MGTQPISKNGLTEFVKLVKPFGNNSTNLLDTKKWIQEMGKTFGALGVLEEQQVSFASFLLQGTTNDYWEAGSIFWIHGWAGINSSNCSTCNTFLAIYAIRCSMTTTS